MNKKYLRALLLIVFPLIILIGGRDKLTKIISTPFSTPQETVVTEGNTKTSVIVTADFGGGKVESMSIPYEEGLTAFTTLEKLSEKASFTLKTKVYDFGTFVESVGNYPSGQDKTWIYYVNQKPGDIASDKYILKPDDKVEWKYEKPIY